MSEYLLRNQNMCLNLSKLCVRSEEKDCTEIGGDNGLIGKKMFKVSGNR